MTSLYCNRGLYSHIQRAQECFLPYLLARTHSTGINRQEVAKTQYVLIQLFVFDKSAEHQAKKIPSKINFTEESQIPTDLVIEIPEHLIERYFSEPIELEAQEGDPLEEEIPTKLQVLVKALTTHEHTASKNVKDCNVCKNQYFAQTLIGDELLQSDKDLAMLFLSCITKAAATLDLSPALTTERDAHRDALQKLNVTSPSSGTPVPVSGRETPANWKRRVIEVLNPKPSKRLPVSASPTAAQDD